MTLFYRVQSKKSDQQQHGEAITSNNKYDLLFGVTTSEALWRFAEKDVQKGFEGERRDKIIRTYVRNAYTYHLTEIFYTVSDFSTALFCDNYLSNIRERKKFLSNKLAIK